MQRGAAFVLASWVALSGCAADSKERVGVAKNFRNEETETRDGRLVITRQLVETYKLTAEDFAQLQLFLHGRILLRREQAGGTREITPEHTLKVRIPKLRPCHG